MTTTPDYPIDPTGPLTVGTIPDADLDRLIAATIPAGSGVEPPAGFKAGDWEGDERGTYRIVYGTSRGVAGRTDISVQPTAIQLGNGCIDDGAVIESPCVHVDNFSGMPLTAAQARRLAAAIMAAADELDGTQ